MAIGQCGDIAGDTQDAETVSPVRCEIEIDDRIGQLEIGDEQLADRRLCGQIEDTVGVISQAEFDGGAKHAIRLHATDLRFPQLDAVRQLGAGQCQGTLHAGSDVRSSTDDSQ